MNELLSIFKKKIIIFFVSIIILFIIFILSLFLFKTEDSISIDGFLISKSKESIKSDINGVIENIFVKNGDFVKKDDVLFLYSSTSIKSAIIEVENQIIAKNSYKDTFQSLINYILFRYPIIINSYNADLEFYQKEARYRQQLYLNMKNLSLIGAYSQSALEKAELDFEEIVFECKKIELKKQEEENNYRRNIEQLNNYGLIDLEKNSIDAILQLIDRDIFFLIHEKERLETVLNNPVVVAPCDGIINFYETYYYNEIEKLQITENEIICDIYLTGDYIVKGLVNNIHLPFIDVGQSVYIEVKAYEYNKYGFIQGTIDKIYTNPIKSDSGDVNYYIDIGFETISENLYNGLEVEIKIRLKKEMSLLEYFIYNTLLDKDNFERNNNFYFIKRKILE